MKSSLFAPLILLIAVSAAHSQESPELQRLRAAYVAALERAQKPVTESYSQELKKLKDSFARAGKLDEAVQVDGELQEITSKLAAMAAAVTPLGARPGQTTVLNATVTIPPNNPDGYKLGPVRKGDVISLQYVSGKWKDHGILAQWNPDEAGSEETSRLAIALPSKGGAPGDTVAVVPPGTVAKPFTYTFPASRDQVVLRISANSNNTANPGAVVYQVKVTR
jgi:hypothetical protein